ncbi:MAG: hypothetical protein AVDCRST_MAG55-2285, partial [uncultured Rubrobacteraceae bacterium]
GPGPRRPVRQGRHGAPGRLPRRREGRRRAGTLDGLGGGAL